MITFKEYVKKIFGEDIVGIYPPQYGGVSQYPPLANQTGPDQVYVKASRNSLKKKKKKKKKKT
jgi:hypothetical protein